MADLPPKRTAVEVVREGRFRYVVVERYDNGLDMSWEPPHRFRWTAERHARKSAVLEQPEVVLRIETPDRP